MTITNPEQPKDPRRSTRVPIRFRIDVEAIELSCEGETIIVNRHGALVKTSRQLELGTRITVYVQRTSKSAPAWVVFASQVRPLEFGISLEQPQNIWGISLPPADWREETA
jgi:hypothetical protein